MSLYYSVYKLHHLNNIQHIFVFLRNVLLQNLVDKYILVVRIHLKLYIFHCFRNIQYKDCHVLYTSEIKVWKKNLNEGYIRVGEFGTRVNNFTQSRILQKSLPTRSKNLDLCIYYELNRFVILPRNVSHPMDQNIGINEHLL